MSFSSWSKGRNKLAAITKIEMEITKNEFNFAIEVTKKNKVGLMKMRGI